MKKITIKGREYTMVHERLMFFREHEAFKNWRLVSEIYELSETRVVMSASIIDDNDRVVAMGHAFEEQGSNFINKTSFIENCETSAWGRALANLGIGIDDSVASGNEVKNAISQDK